MDITLFDLMDYQRFHREKALDAMIEETGKKYNLAGEEEKAETGGVTVFPGRLSDDDLSRVSAAMGVNVTPKY